MTVLSLFQTELPKQSQDQQSDDEDVSDEEDEQPQFQVEIVSWQMLTVYNYNCPGSQLRVNSLISLIIEGTVAWLLFIGSC